MLTAGLPEPFVLRSRPPGIMAFFWGGCASRTYNVFGRLFFLFFRKRKKGNITAFYVKRRYVRIRHTIATERAWLFHHGPHSANTKTSPEKQRQPERVGGPGPLPRKEQ
jgi:hypothetical protein